MAAKLPLEGKTRTILIAAVAVIVVGILVGFWSFNRSTDSATPPPPSVTVSARAPESRGKDVNPRSSPLYDQLLQRSNEKMAADAARSGGSAMPVLRTGIEKDQQASPTIVSVTPPPQPRRANSDQSQANALAERERAIKERRSAMGAQLVLLQKAWSIEGHAQMVAPTDKAEPIAGTTKRASMSTSVAGTGAPVSPTFLVKAGESVVAQLDTPIDTDNPLPVYRATIIEEGPLHGAVLLGTIQGNTAANYGSGVPFSFTQISIPGQAIQPVSAFAINAADAGALKGEVNRHVLARYSAAFGGAFLQGVGQGLMQGGRAQQVITSSNGYAVQSDAFTNKQLLFLGAANVGQLAAGALQRAVSRPPTITIPGQTTIGVFFTADLPAISISKGRMQ